MRGRLFRSDDEGRRWQAVAGVGTAGITAGTALPGGAIVLVDQAGGIALSRDGGQRFVPVPALQPMPYFGVAALGAQRIGLVGAAGVRLQTIAVEQISRRTMTRIARTTPASTPSDATRSIRARATCSSAWSSTTGSCCWLLCAVLTAFFAWQLRGLRRRRQLRQDAAARPPVHPELPREPRPAARPRRLGAHGGRERRSGDIFDASYLATLAKINDEIFLLPGVDRAWMKSHLDAGGALGRGHRGRLRRRAGACRNDYDGSAEGDRRRCA